MEPRTAKEIREMIMPVVYAGPATAVSAALDFTTRTFVTLDMARRPYLRELGGLIRREGYALSGSRFQGFNGRGGGCYFYAGFEAPVVAGLAFVVYYRDWPGFFRSLAETGRLTVLPARLGGPSGPNAYVLEGYGVRLAMGVSRLAELMERWRAAGG